MTSLVGGSILERFSLIGKAAVVTGASSGLGARAAVALAEAGAHVALGARRADRLKQTEQLVQAHGVSAIGVVTDVASAVECSRLVASAMEAFGRVDILVNCAGVATAIPATKETPDEFRRVLDVNLMGSYWMAQACGRVMQPGSSIVNVGSVLGETSFGMPQAAYTASKSGLMGLTRDLAQQWAQRKGIRVNLIAPGLFVTEMLDEYPPGFSDDVIAQRVPLARAGHADEFASAVIFLASDAASYITGVSLAVDGGLLTK